MLKTVKDTLIKSSKACKDDRDEEILNTSPVHVHSECQNLRPWSSWTANSDKEYMELNLVTFNVNKPCVTSRKTAFLKYK